MLAGSGQDGWDPKLGYIDIPDPENPLGNALLLGVADLPELRLMSASQTWHDPILGTERREASLQQARRS